MDSVLYVLKILFTNEDVLKLIGTIVGAMTIWVVKQLISWIGLKLKADRMAMLQAVIDKAMMFAVTKTEDMIRDKGWDSMESKHVVINRAIPVLEEKFAHTLRANGLDLSRAEDRLKVVEQMERMIPDLFARAAASPATPPAPVVPAVVIPSPAGP